jgi:hypothetical protein
MKNANIDRLHRLIEELKGKRKELMSAIAEIDEAFSALQVAPGQSTGRRAARTSSGGTATTIQTQSMGPPRKRRASAHRKYGMTAQDMVLDVIRKSLDGATGKEINKAWVAAGRSGEVYNTLGELVRSKAIKRVKIPDGRGSIYRIA